MPHATASMLVAFEASEARNEARELPFLSMRLQPIGDVGNDGRVNMLRRLVVRRRGRPCTREEQVVISLVDTDRDIRAAPEARPPPREIVFDGHLIVTATLED